MIRIAACLLLVCVSASVAAREIRLQAPSEGGGRCPEVAAAAAEATAVADKPHAPAPAPARRAKVSKPVSARGGSDAPRISAPRWHSFLPGMFR